jgi:plastocyanin
MHNTFKYTGLLITLAALTACGGGAGGDKGAPASGGAPAAVAATGTVHEITMTTDDKGSFFTPNTISAKPGDVLRFKLAVGVHNVNFLPDSNPGKSGLPAVSTFLQLPGQTYDVPLTFGDGTFYFQCDPHAALGMKGHVTVAK